jgi:Holliday junction resolvase RusA-like endonuclease
MKNIVITGNPISVNALYQGRRFLTSKGKSLKLDYAWQVKTQWKSKPLDTRLKMTITAYFGSKRIRDLDNIGKIVLDAFTGIVYEDDGQIDELTFIRKYSKENPRVEIQLKTLHENNNKL